MTKSSYYLIFVFSTILTISCKQRIISLEQERALINLTEAEYINLNEKENNVHLEIYNSGITDSSERRLFSSIISKTVYDITNKNKTTIDNDGSVIIIFVDSTNKSVFEYSNKYLLKIGDIYESLTEFLKKLINKNKSIYSLISDVYSESQKDSIFNSSLILLNFSSETTFDSYGFTKDNYVFQNSNIPSYRLYMKIVDDNFGIKHYSFLFEEETVKFLNFDEIE